MPTNHYFRPFPGNVKTNEQRLFEDLLVESIKIHGHDIYYIPRETWSDTDTIFGENMQSKFDRAYLIEVYIANVDGYEGDGDFFSKFGLEIRENSNFILSKRSFEKIIPSSITIRPREGDLLYVPVMTKLFEIKFVEEELMFFTKGHRIPYVYELRCETYRASNEQFNTGVEIIDQVDVDASYTIQLTLGGSGNYNIGEIVYQGNTLNTATATAKVGNWEPTNNTIYLVEIKGDFSTTGNLVGSTSLTTRSVAASNTQGDYVYYDFFDNKQLQTEANTFMDLSEINPFGLP